MGKWITDFGQQVAQGAAGGILGLAFGGIQDRRQLKQQEKLQNLQIEGQKQMADYNLKKQLELWNATNYSAQKDQLKAAGLNPGLLYGMGGGGGATTSANTGNVTGGTAHGNAGEAISMAQSFAQLGLMRAQRENIEADTANKQADTTKKSGVDTQEAETRIASLLVGMENTKAETELKKVQTQLSNLDKELKSSTLQESIDRIGWEADQAFQRLEQAKNETYISNQTKHNQVKIVTAELNRIWLTNALTKAQTDKTKSDIQVNQAQIDKWSNEISLALLNTDIKQQELKLQKIKTDFETQNPSLSQYIGGYLKEARQWVEHGLKKIGWKSPQEMINNK